ncbi:alpha/beta fold hydrolase [Maribacter polysiphoniae]|uniref:Alpha/beta fold hydrolase n=1 Tax=Maribacter polysiphoniae TaxID=429344 RepID=A0A316E335_9FLAO|nr:alpha/beta fold hydrolase [Maribacter polysiphoniae]MBD1259542.1 alpha/beta fold hydrolase [Maribacter polysiphoniae]PWK25107.1 pimeloyl-ACP methyl ester carboxylesterase [Maribacter polysiphoniae]
MNPVLHSNILGSGKPLLILHGFLGMSDNWKTLGSKYSEHGMQVHLIDQRNHGRSFHAEEFNYDILAEDLRNYIEQHELRDVIILGHSMGGKTAMQFAVRYPDLIQKLIVADIAPKYYPPHHEYIINGLNHLDFGVIKSRGEADSELSKYIQEKGIRQFLLKNLYWVEKGKLAFRFNLEVLSHKMEEIGEGLSAIDQYNGPTLFLRGDKSEYIIPSDSEIIRRHFPNAVIESIDHAGHWLHAENPTQFFNKTFNFIKS